MESLTLSGTAPDGASVSVALSYGLPSEGPNLFDPASATLTGPGTIANGILTIDQTSGHAATLLARGLGLRAGVPHRVVVPITRLAGDEFGVLVNVGGDTGPGWIRAAETLDAVFTPTGGNDMTIALQGDALHCDVDLGGVEVRQVLPPAS